MNSNIQPRPWKISWKRLWAVSWLGGLSVCADLTVTEVRIGDPTPGTRVPAATSQGRLLSPQASSAVDISADGKFITVATMAFSHDASVWQFSSDGAVIRKRHFSLWAPMQVATLNGGEALAVALAWMVQNDPAELVAEGRQQFGGKDWMMLEFHNPNTRPPRTEIKYFLVTPLGGVTASVVGTADEFPSRRRLVNELLGQIRVE